MTIKSLSRFTFIVMVVLLSFGFLSGAEARDHHDRYDNRYDRDYDRPSVRYYQPPVRYYRPAPPRVVYYQPAYRVYEEPVYYGPAYREYYEPQSSIGFSFNFR